MRYLFTFIALLTIAIPAAAQQDSRYGKILTVESSSVTVTFDQVTVRVGDEIIFLRRNEIVDPVSGKVMGGREQEIGTGIVEDISLGKASVNIVTRTPGAGAIRMTDRVRLGSEDRNVIKRARLVTKVRTIISNEELEIDAGSDDEISEGDLFLIQRTETVFDPETNTTKETKTVEVGRGRVSEVASSTSRAEVLEIQPGMTLSDTDQIVFEATTSAPPITAAPDTPAPGTTAAPMVDSAELTALREEIARLESDVAMLRASLDSLGTEHRIHREEFEAFRDDMDEFAAGMISRAVREPDSDLPDPEADSRGAVIPLPDSHPPEAATQVVTPAELNASYQRGLALCLAHSFPEAILVFQGIISQYPGDPLTENCRYWIGQSYYSSGDLAAAAEAFIAVISDTRFSHKDDDAAIMLGITRYRQGETTEASRVFQEFLTRHPSSEYAGKVRRWVDRLSK